MAKGYGLSDLPFDKPAEAYDLAKRMIDAGTWGPEAAEMILMSVKKPDLLASRIKEYLDLKEGK